MPDIFKLVCQLAVLSLIHFRILFRFLFFKVGTDFNVDFLNIFNVLFKLGGAQILEMLRLHVRDSEVIHKALLLRHKMLKLSLDSVYFAVDGVIVMLYLGGSVTLALILGVMRHNTLLLFDKLGCGNQLLRYIRILRHLSGILEFLIGYLSNHVALVVELRLVVLKLCEPVSNADYAQKCVGFFLV